MSSTYPSVITHGAKDSACPAFWDALRDVTDPELPISVVDMGLIVALSEQDGIVDIKLTFTAMGCPAMEFIMDDIRARLLQAPGVREVRIEIVWDPVWTKARLTEEGIEILRNWGVSA
jgi:metal-sulfur cluster biosynthetic enzyme